MYEFSFPFIIVLLLRAYFVISRLESRPYIEIIGLWKVDIVAIDA